ncbi:MAG: methyltransferase family protein [Planctomycetota bacterium]
MPSSLRPTPRRLLAYLLGALVLVFARPDAVMIWLGLGLAVPGLLLRIWATGYLSKNRRLTREGPYRHLRHPLYLGTWLIGTGLFVACLGRNAPRVPLILLFAVFQLGFLFFYLPRKEAKESRRLRRIHGREFELFSQMVPAFLPRLRPATAPGPGVDWRLSRVASNSEWGTFSATILGFAFLGLRCLELIP